MAKDATKSTDQLFPFMRLLPELRIRVYEYLFEDFVASMMLPTFTRAQIQSLNDYQRPHIRNTFALLHTSQVFRTECMEVYARLQKVHAARLPTLISSLSVQLKDERDFNRFSHGHQKLTELHIHEVTMHKLEV
jgi:hypothetical protein